FINVSNCSKSICCCASESATAGSGCTSAIIPSAPIAIPALAAGINKSLLPVECVTSTITGKCVSCFKIGTDEISNVFRVAVSYVLILRSQRIILPFPLEIIYSAAPLNSEIVADIPRFKITGLSVSPTFFNNSKFCMFLAPIESQRYKPAVHQHLLVEQFHLLPPNHNQQLHA